MPRWSRDPRMRKRLAWALAVGEALALTGNLCPISWGALRFFTPGFSAPTLLGISLAATAVCLAVTMLEAVKYVRGCGWVRVLLMVQNVVLIGAGAAWFYFTHRSHSDAAPLAAGFGLMMPMASLFPLLWPLATFRPVPPPASPDQGYQY